MVAEDGTSSRFTFRPIDEAGARVILTWQYDLPYDFYNFNPDESASIVRTFLDPLNCYYAIMTANGDLFAYSCFGPDAQVHGGDYSTEAVDFGMGMRPDLTGHGLGTDMINAALDFARLTFEQPRLRATVAGWNQRAVRACEKAGFEVQSSFHRPDDGQEFVVLVCRA